MTNRYLNPNRGGDRRPLGRRSVFASLKAPLSSKNNNHPIAANTPNATTSNQNPPRFIRQPGSGAYTANTSVSATPVSHSVGGNRRPSSGFSRNNNRRFGGNRGGSSHSVSLSRKTMGALQTENTDRKDAPLPKKEVFVPPLLEGNIRIIPLGGVEEIGKNMTAIEYKNDIIVIDAGFQFKADDTPGVDYILPNTTYLEERQSKIRGVFITHGHLDHIGGVPYIMPRIGNPTIYTREFSALMLKKRQEEFPHYPPLNIKYIDPKDTLRVGEFVISFFNVSHTIPDSMGLIIKTPYGNIVYTGDLKVDTENGRPTEKEEKEYERFKNEKTLLLMAESTSVENPGFTIPELTVHTNLEKIIKNAEGRIIIGTFASLLERIIKVIEISERYGKKIVIEGRSMKNSVEIALQMGILKVKSDTLIKAEDMEIYPPDRVVVIATGAQGDEFAALMRMSTKSHKYLKLNKRDVVVLSSSIIPGNEKAVQKLKDNLSRQGAHIIHYKMDDVHASGHGNREDFIWLHEKIQAKYFIPIHGYHYMLRVHSDLVTELGTPEKNIIIPDNGMIIEIQDQGEKMVKLKEKAASGLVLVDGFSIGDVQEVVIRDRQMLAEDGMFIIIATINQTTGHLRKSPDIISRGFVYLRESQEMLHQARQIIKKTIEESTAGLNPINFDYVKAQITDNVSKFLYQQAGKKPMVIPVLIGI